VREVNVKVNPSVAKVTPDPADPRRSPAGREQIGLWALRIGCPSRDGSCRATGAVIAAKARSLSIRRLEWSELA